MPLGVIFKNVFHYYFLFQFSAAGFNSGPPTHRGGADVPGNRTSIGATLKNMFMGSLTSRRNQGGPGTVLSQVVLSQKLFVINT